MPIPNVSTLYQRINKGSEGGNEFARFIKLLLIADYEAKGEKFISETDASGDYKKVDAFILGDKDFPNNITGFHFKFFPNALSANQKTEIIHAIERALAENKFIQELIIITPEDFHKEQQLWFDKLKTKYEKSYALQSNGLIRQCSFLLSHWGHSKIIELSLKHDHISSHYFPELFPAGVGKFKLAESKIDCSNCNWHPSQHGKFRYYQSFQMMNPNLTSDPVFDFQFTNSSPDIFLLQKLEIHIEEIKTQMRGFPAEYFLKSIGTFEYEIDFTKPVNTISFEDPMVFEASKPLRFKLQLKNFTQKCPGNFASLKFWFHFSNYSVATNTFSLAF